MRRAMRSFLSARFTVTVFSRLATETTGGEILVAFWLINGLRSDVRAPNFKNFTVGACPQTPLICLHLCLTPMAVPV